jgi:hypothetical protein
METIEITLNVTPKQLQELLILVSQSKIEGIALQLEQAIDDIPTEKLWL